MEVLKSMKIKLNEFPDEKEFWELDFRQQSKIFRKFCWYSIRTQLIIALGAISPMWLVSYYLQIGDIPMAANFVFPAVVAAIFYFALFPVIWDVCKPKWVESFIKENRKKFELWD